MRTYDRLKRIKTFDERFEYLKLTGKIGSETFGVDRYLNQVIYRSAEWKKTRRNVIIRDLGRDLGVEGYEIYGIIIIHHMNPITIEQAMNRDPIIFDMNYLISTSLTTHNAIHYGDESIIPRLSNERRPGDTKLW